MKKEISVKCPMTPNFIETELGTMSITEFSKEELKKIGEEWTEELIKKAAYRRENKES